MLTIRGAGRRFVGKPAVNGIFLMALPRRVLEAVVRSGTSKPTVLQTINRFVAQTADSMGFNSSGVTEPRGHALHDWLCPCTTIFRRSDLVGRRGAFSAVLFDHLDDTLAARALFRLWRPADVAVVLSAHEPFDVASSAGRRADGPSSSQQQRFAANDGPAFALMAFVALDLRGLEADEALGAPEPSLVDGFRAAALA